MASSTEYNTTSVVAKDEEGLLVRMKSDWWEGNIPWKDCLGQVAFVASIGIGFALSASVTLACSSSFQGRTDNTTIAMLTSTSQIFAWGASAFGVALIASITGMLMTQTGSLVLALQSNDAKEKEIFPNKEAKEKLGCCPCTGKCYEKQCYIPCIGACIRTAFAGLAIVSLGSIVAGTALTGVGLNTMAGGSGTMLEWALLVVGFPMAVVTLVAVYMNGCCQSEHANMRPRDQRRNGNAKVSVRTKLSTTNN
jgi:hypothetical protein